MSPIEDVKIVVNLLCSKPDLLGLRITIKNEVPSKTTGFLMEGGLGEGGHAPRS